MQSETVFDKFRMERIKLGLVPKTRLEFEDEMLRELESAEAVEAAGLSHRVTKEDLMAETDHMIASEEDFPLGDGDHLAEPGMSQDEGLIKEVRP